MLQFLLTYAALLAISFYSFHNGRLCGLREAADARRPPDRRRS